MRSASRPSAPGLAELLGGDALGALVPGRRPVRAILFDKSPGANWALGWYKDRTIAVRERVETSGFGPWSVKQGLFHVEPPFALIEAICTMRVHLDPVPEGNAPLRIATGSHRLGRIPEAELAEVVERCGTATCLAEAGDVWLYATPIVHRLRRRQRGPAPARAPGRLLRASAAGRAGLARRVNPAALPRRRDGCTFEAMFNWFELFLPERPARILLGLLFPVVAIFALWAAFG